MNEYGLDNNIALIVMQWRLLNWLSIFKPKTDELSINYEFRRQCENLGK